MNKARLFLLLLLCFTLIAGLLPGCDSNTAAPEKEELTIEEEILQRYYYHELNESFRKTNPMSSLSLRFRGAFSDSYVLFVDGPFSYFAAVTKESIGGVVFTYQDSQTPLVYHQGSFYSMKEAYALGYLTLDDIVQLYTQYGSNLNIRINPGDVPTVREPCTHTAPPQTDPTVPTEPPSIMELMPDIPPVTNLCEKPETLTAETLVSTIYDHIVSWNDKHGATHNAIVKIPAIVPFCDGAVEINEAIRKRYQYRVESIRRAYENQFSSDTIQISYSATLNENLLCIKVHWLQEVGVFKDDVWILNIHTGSQLDTADMAKLYLQESYPAFLQRCTYNLIEYSKAHPVASLEKQEALMKHLPCNTDVMHSYELFLDEDGTLMICLFIGELRQTYTFPYDSMDSYGFEGTEESGYSWLFHLRSDGAGAESLDSILLESFFQDPAQFIRMLALEDEATISHIASSLNYALYHPEKIAEYKRLCETLRDTSSITRHSEVAQILLDNLHPL